jgi:hypothetical protein
VFVLFIFYLWCDRSERLLFVFVLEIYFPWIYSYSKIRFCRPIFRVAAVRPAPSALVFLLLGPWFSGPHRSAPESQSRLRRFLFPLKSAPGAPILPPEASFSCLIFSFPSRRACWPWFSFPLVSVRQLVHSPTLFFMTAFVSVASRSRLWFSFAAQERRTHRAISCFSWLVCAPARFCFVLQFSPPVKSQVSIFSSCSVLLVATNSLASKDLSKICWKC